MAYKRILLKGDPLQKEAKASGAILPGMLIEHVTNEATVRAHATAMGNAAGMVAIENSLEGDEIGDTYADADQVQYVHLRPGDEFLAYIASGVDVTFGNFLCSNGNGYFKVLTTLTEDTSGISTYEQRKAFVAQALETISGTSSGAKYCKAVCV